MSAINSWRGAGVVERGGLENRCALWVPWVRIPPPPPKIESKNNFQNCKGIKPLSIIYFSVRYYQNFC